jgi:hypothetical protein
MADFTGGIFIPLFCLHLWVENDAYLDVIISFTSQEISSAMDVPTKPGPSWVIQSV